MLARLSIRDIVLIDRLDLTVDTGLSVLSGETGAGKSILLDAFALALGARGDGSLVRHGEAQGQVTAVFDLPLDHPARALAGASELDTEGDLILRRVQMADGRTRAFVNDQPVSVQVLRQIGAALVEIHGQHDDRALADPDSHRAILDAHAGAQPLAATTEQAWRRWREARQAVDERRQAVEKAAREADYLRHAVEELGRLAPGAGEEEELAERRHRMQQAQKVAGELSEALEAVGGQGLISELSGAVRRLERRAQQAPALVEGPIRGLDAAINALEEARSELERAVAEAAFDPGELEACEERLFALRAAARKYDVGIAELAELAERLAAQLALIDAGEQDLARREAEAAEAAETYRRAAEALSEARRAAGAALEQAVAEELPPLKLERARFLARIDTDPASPGPGGIDRVAFWVQTNPGTAAGPMLKVASGGELSRFMLALKVVLADRGSAPTLIFDEIDTGVGGAVADAIGERLARLARKVQVMAVTHAPQVAAKADQHFLIAKHLISARDAAPDRVVTRVDRLDDPSRREELARMLAGATITDEARAAATRLLAGAL